MFFIFILLCDKIIRWKSSDIERVHTYHEKIIILPGTLLRGRTSAPCPGYFPEHKIRTGRFSHYICLLQHFFHLEPELRRHDFYPLLHFRPCGNVSSHSPQQNIRSQRRPGPCPCQPDQPEACTGNGCTAASFKPGLHSLSQSFFRQDP